MNKIIAFIVAFTLLSNQIAFSAAGSSFGSSYESQSAQIKRLISAAREIRENIDRRAFNLDALLDSLNYNSEEILSFVSEDIAYEQYSGTLRGATGTLMGRAGNSLDQSILLATLLKNAGYDARIAKGQLTITDAKRLISGMSKPRTRQFPIGDAEKILSVLQRLGVTSAKNAKAAEYIRHRILESPLPQQHPAYNRVLDTSRQLTNKMKSIGINVAPPDFKALEQEASEYFWVQFRESAAGEWLDAHPTFATQPAPNLNVSDVFADSVPESFQHKLSVQVFIERKIGDRLEAVAVTKPWTRPTANLNAVPIVFSNVPNTMFSGYKFSSDIRQLVKSANWYAPTFGGSATGAQFFDLSGNLIDPMVAGNAAAGLFQRIGELFGGAVETLSEGQAPTLTAQWLEFTITSPTGESRNYRRYTLDRIGPAVRNSGKMPAEFEKTKPEHLFPLTQKHTFMVSNGETPRGMAIDYVLENLLKSEPYFVGLLDELSNPDANKQPSFNAAEVPTHWSGHLALFTQFDQGNSLVENIRTYRSGPMLVLYREGLNDDHSVVKSVDIIQNPKRRTYGGNEKTEPKLSPTLMAGVWETEVEGILIAPDNKLLNTAAVFNEAKETNVGLTVYNPGTRPVLGKYPEDVAASLQTDITNGFAVIVPNRLSASRAAWWRIDPATGETLGQIATGRGAGELIKYLAILTYGVSAALLAVSLVGCAGEYQQSVLDEDPVLRQYNAIERGELVCCTMSALLTFAVGLMLGGVGGAATGVEAHGMYEAAMSWNLISTVVPNPICSSYDSGDP